MSDVRFKPTAKMAAYAKRGLKLREKFSRGGTAVGIRRAHQLAEREAVYPKDIVSIASHFARHAVDKDAKNTQWGDTANPSAGFIAWLLWGGEEGRVWSARNRALAKSSQRR